MLTQIASRALASVALLTPWNAALAQQTPVTAVDPSGDTSGEIIVTARKRSESLQNTPLSITAVSGAAIEQKGLVKIDQIGASSPNVKFQAGNSVPGDFTAFIRGIGNRGAEPSQDVPVAVSIDGVYLAVKGGSLIDLFDVQQVEVLRGPQGTLQGRNSPGGAVNITTRRPTGEFGGRVEASYARFDEVQLKGMIEAPLVKNVLSARLNLYRNSGGSFMRNTTTGGRTAGGITNWGGRLGILFTPTESFKAYLTADYIRDTSQQPPLRPVPHAGPAGPLEPSPLICTVFGVCSPAGKYETGSDFTDRMLTKSGGAAINADWDLGSVTLTSVTGYRKVHQDFNLDDDATGVVALHIPHRLLIADQVSQELRLASNGSSRLSYVVGLYALRSKFSLNQPVVLGGALFSSPTDVASGSDREQVTHSYAAFGQMTYKILPTWSISGGARESFDRKRMETEPTVPGPRGTFKAKFDNFSFELGSELRLDRQKFVYARFSQGYLAGGVNGDAPTLADVNVFRPVTVDAYEIGLKTEWWDRRFTVNVAAFYNDFSDLQLTAAAPSSGTGFVQRVVNAPGLKMKGVEVETTLRPAEGLALNGSFGYLHSRYRSAILDLGSGIADISTLPKDYAPKTTAYFGANYRTKLGSGGGSMTFDADVDYRSHFYVNPVPSPVARQSQYALVNASITYRTPDDRYSISLFGRNLTNHYYKTGAETGGGFFMWDSVGRPRTYGVRANAEF